LRKIELAQLKPEQGLSSDSNLESNSENKHFFSKETIDLSSLEQLDVDINLNLGAVRFNNNPILNGNAHLTANKTGLFIISENLSLLGGHSYFFFDLKRTKKEPTLRLKLSSDNIQLDRIRLKNENDTLMSKGKADLVLSLKSSGASTAAIAASTNGYISAFVSDAEIKQKYASALDAGIVNWGNKKISRLSKDRSKKKKSTQKRLNIHYQSPVLRSKVSLTTVP